MTRVSALLVVLAAAAAAQEPFARVTPLQMPPHVALRDADYADVDGDGLADLVLSEHHGETRALRIHLQRRADVPFVAQADFELDPVWRDVVAYAVGDVHTDPGAEVVLFTAGGAWAWRPRAPEKERVVKLAEASFLWQLPDPAEVVAWPAGVRDIDGDGLADLVLPQPEGYRLAFQTRADGTASFDAPPPLVVPGGGSPESSPALSVRRRARSMRTEFAVRFGVGGRSGDDDEFKGPLLDVDDAVPAPQFLDWDADGDLDLLAATDKWLFVWEQDKGRFAARPQHSFVVPVVADRERILDVSYSAHVLDLNRDGRADCIMFAGDRRSEDVRTQVLVFVQGAGRGPNAQTPAKPLFGPEGLPTQLLVLTGFAGNPSLEDIDGDGYPDLFVGSVRPDLLDALRGSGGNIEAELSVFLNRKGTFSRRPDLSYRASVEAEGLRLARRALLARFFGDVTGDGVRELLLRDDREHVKVLATRRARDGSLSLHDQPLWDLRVAVDADVRVSPRAGASPELLVLERDQILHVRFP